MFYRSDDPIKDAERYYDALEEQLASRPVCGVCGEHIQEDTAVFYDDHWICDECIENLREYIEEE